MENANGKNKRRDLLLTDKLRLVPWGIERMPQRTQRHRKATLHWSAYPQREQDETKNLAMAWIDYKKAFDIVPQSWIINCLKIYKISNEVINFIEKTMKTWKVELTVRGKSLLEAKIQRVILQGDALSPSLFINAMMPLIHSNDALPDKKLVNRGKRSIT